MGIVGGSQTQSVLYNHKVYMKTMYENTMKSTLKFVIEVPEQNKVVAVHVMPTLTSMNMIDTVSEVTFASVCMRDPQGHKNAYEHSGKRDNRDRFEGKTHEHYVLSLNNRAPVKICLDGVVDPDQMRMCVNKGIAKEYTRFVNEVVRFRETSREAFEEWAEKTADGNMLLTNKIKMRAYADATLDALMNLVPQP